MTVNLPVSGQDPWDATLNAAISGLDTRLATVEASSGGGGTVDADLSGAWFAGRRWYPVGTSLTQQAFYVTRLATLSGMNMVTNLGASGGSLCTAGGTTNGNVWANLVQVPADAEVVTLETCNDVRLSAVLGTMADPEVNGHTISFYGAMKEACAWLLTHRPAARIFTITNYADALTGGSPPWGNFYNPNSSGNYPYQFNDVIRIVSRIYGIPCIEVSEEAGINYFTNQWFTSDTIHMNDLGGQRYAEYCWTRMRHLGWLTSRPTTPGSAPNVAVTGVTIDQGSAVSVAPAATTQLSCTVAPGNATNKAVTWSSGTTSVATVSTNGLVTGVANGTSVVTVTTTDGGKTATLTVTVTTSTIHVTGVTVAPTAATVLVLGPQQLTPTVLPANASDKTVAWQSSNTGVATVNSSGLVTGVAVGTATITCTTTDGSHTATSTITVSPGESWTMNPQTVFRGIGLTGVTATGSNPTYTNTTGTFGALLINTSGQNAIEFAIADGTKGHWASIGSNGSTDFVAIGSVTGGAFDGYNHLGFFASGAYTNMFTPTPTANPALPGTNVIYRVGRVGNRVKIVRVDPGPTLVTIWDGDLPTNFPSNAAAYATVDLGVVGIGAPGSGYTMPINCKTGTWAP